MINPQAESGADALQIFDSWGGQLPPLLWPTWSGQYIKRMIELVKKKHPNVPITLYMAGKA